MRNSRRKVTMHILYATDGSRETLAGARLLSSLPLRPADEVRVLHVVGRDDTDIAPSALTAAREALATDAAVVTEVRHGHAAEEIIASAAETPTDLIVVGTHGRSALQRFLVGSVAERVARHASVPVLLARPEAEALSRVLVAYDGSECSRAAWEWTRQLPLPGGIRLRLVAATPPIGVLAQTHSLYSVPMDPGILEIAEEGRRDLARQLEELTAAESIAGRATDMVTREGDPAREIIEAASEWPADLVVLGSHGASGIERFLLGSVSEKVLRHAPSSVLLVKGSSASG
jgi:nucleotide-binding universal stress UspA family protein